MELMIYGTQFDYSCCKIKVQPKGENLWKREKMPKTKFLSVDYNSVL